MTDNLDNFIKAIQDNADTPIAMKEVSYALARSNIIATNSDNEKEKFFAMQTIEVLTSLLSDQFNLLKSSQIDAIIANNPYKQK